MPTGLKCDAIKSNKDNKYNVSMMRERVRAKERREDGEQKRVCHIYSALVPVFVFMQYS